MASEFKYHHKSRYKTIVNHIPEVLYASTVPFSNKVESLKSRISMLASSTKLTSFSSPSHELLASPDCVSFFKTDFCRRKYCFRN